MTRRTLHLTCYDISAPNRLKAALEVSKRFATGGQKSVHECWLAETERADLLYMLAHVIDEHEDRVLIVSLDGRRDVVPLGTARSPCDQDYILIGANP